jgi:hypothetical protein
MDRPYPTSLTFTPAPLEVAESSIVAPIILNVFVTTNTALLQWVVLVSRNEIHYSMTFGGDYGFKDSAENVILSS